MSEFERRKSGLVVPVPPEKTTRKIGALEVSSKSRRESVEAALLGLWDALELSHFRKLDNPQDAQNHNEHLRLYRFVGESLLGNDCPSREELC